MTARRRYRGWLAVSLGGLVALSWVCLWWLERSPLGALFHAHGHAHHAVAATERSVLGEGLMFTAGWTLMSIAMMLPAAFPVIEIFGRLVRRKPQRLRLITLLVVGYLLTWTVFGVAAFAGRLAIDPVVAGSLPDGVYAAALFVAAGLFQFSALKYRCLDECRVPLSFVTRRWNTGAQDVRALRLGVEHGVFCVGCCWALMLLMFAVSTSHLLWMLVLALLMAVEKNWRWGRRVARPLGYALIVAGLGVAALHLPVI